MYNAKNAGWLIEVPDYNTFKDACKTGSHYFRITGNIILEDNLSVPEDSVLDFRGGCFSGDFSLDLNGAHIRAPHVCIFDGNVNVSGLYGNPAVHGEWFRSSTRSESDGDESFINRALIAAKGIPVILGKKTYQLKKRIRIDGVDSDIMTYTFICPGTLKLTNDTVAIGLGKSWINVDVYQILGPDLPSHDVRDATVKDQFKGTGVQFYTNVYNGDVTVRRMSLLGKGFEIVPGTPTLNPDISKRISKTDTHAGVQYCRLKFRQITATYCIYCDILTPDPFHKIRWISESQINGGRIDGKYGIYIKADKDFCNGMVFRNITLGELTGVPMSIIGNEFCYYYNFNTTSHLPGFGMTENVPSWFEWSDTRYTIMTFTGRVNPERFAFNDKCDRLFIYGIIDNPENNRFNTLFATTLADDGGTTAILRSLTSTIQPSNMTRVIKKDPTMNALTVEHLLPKIKTSQDKSDSFDVLPSTVIFDISPNEVLNLNLAMLKYITPAFDSFYAKIDSGGKINMTTDFYFAFDVDGTSKYSTTITESGFYKLDWTEDLKLYIHKIAK